MPLSLRKKTTLFFGISALLLPVIFLILDWHHPLPQTNNGYATVVTARHGQPLRAFADNNGVWRYPIKPADVSPLYLEALLNYEDRWFYQHPGVNPLALIRAAAQALWHGEIISGGSTLTMQVARLLDPHPKTIRGKLKQIFRALQLEWHYSKAEILTLYLNRAPFGGPLEGVQAASFAYLDKSAAELSHAEAALLAVLPQAPSRLRPDRHPQRAQAARDKVLKRLATFGVWDKTMVDDARIETVIADFHPRPMLAPLLARRLKATRGIAVIHTTLDFELQSNLEDYFRQIAATQPPQSSIAALVVDNATLAVRAYIGSADFNNASRAGHVDMLQAQRSPGSTLKPFLYGQALEDGLIHSASLLVDAPQRFEDYRPGNFNRLFAGPLTVTQALQRSINLTAVDVLDRLGPTHFVARLRRGGLPLKLPPHQAPNLSVILGGVGTTLEHLVGAYTALARGGKAGKPRLYDSAPIVEYPMLEPGAAWIIRQILQNQRRPDLPAGAMQIDARRRVAWKTGTSYGARDAWAVGVTDSYTVGVWVGRPDGAALPGQFGAATAAPLVFAVIDSLPAQDTAGFSQPDSVSRTVICWPLGLEKNTTPAALCQREFNAWVLDGAVPPTLPDRHNQNWVANPVQVLINPANQKLVTPNCEVANAQEKTIARWPQAVLPWLTESERAHATIPPLDPACGIVAQGHTESVEIISLDPEVIIQPPPGSQRAPTVELVARGGRGHLYWLITGKMIAQGKIDEPQRHTFTQTGRHEITVFDRSGNYDSVVVTVRD